jgi:hypothetical protein
VITAGGCGATWSPGGARIAFYDGFGIAIKDVEAPPGAQELIVPNERLGITPETHTVVGPEGHITAVCAGLGISWWSPTKTYLDEELGVEIEYPATWAEGAPDAPFRPCTTCVIFGPPHAAHPYGVRLLTAPWMEGCLPGCYIIGSIGRAQESPEETLSIDGRPASRVEIRVTVPLGLASDTGDHTPYHETYTRLRVGDHAFVLIAFWRDGDGAAEQEMLAAYETLLRSLRLQ